jgi:DNA-binding transcriptional MerR regulator
MATDKDNFTFTDVERIVPHIKRTTAQMWVNTGLIVPRENRTGRGLSRVYSFDNLIRIWAAAELSAVWGVSTDGIRSILQLPSFAEAAEKRGRFYSTCLTRIPAADGWPRKSGRLRDGFPGSTRFTSGIVLDLGEIAKEIEKRS